MFHIQLEISGDRELNVGITKEKFNELCSDLFDRAMSFIDYALSTAQLSVEDINHVVILIIVFFQQKPFNNEAA